MEPGAVPVESADTGLSAAQILAQLREDCEQPSLCEL